MKTQALVATALALHPDLATDLAAIRARFVELSSAPSTPDDWDDLGGMIGNLEGIVDNRLNTYDASPMSLFGLKEADRYETVRGVELIATQLAALGDVVDAITGDAS
jgi:hypothetical protein